VPSFEVVVRNFSLIRSQGGLKAFDFLAPIPTRSRRVALHPLRVGEGGERGDDEQREDDGG
jgi:hypothetical protein